MPIQLNDSRTFERLGAEECWLLVRSQGVGRIGFMGETHVQIVPTRYDAQRGAPYFRGGTFVAMAGTAHRVEDAATVAARWSVGRPSPWLPSPESQWIALAVDDIQGERVLP
jgi:Pyridoxamine 5'-phosphate oxidase